MKKILAATNFSVNATHATRRAALLAGSAGDAQLDVLHVLPPTGRGTRWIGPSEDEIVRFERASAQMSALLRLVRSTTDNVVADGRVARGPLKHTIADAAEGADLLVMGGPRRSPLFPVGLTHRLLRKTPLPVLIVRKPPMARYSRVLVAVDFSTMPAEAIRIARTVAPDARLDIVHAYRGEFEGRLQYAGVSAAAVENHRADAHLSAVFRVADLLSSQKSLPSLTTAHVVHGRAADEVLAKEAQFGAGLVVVSRPAKSLVEEWLIPSVTSTLLDAGTADILVVPV